MKKYLLLVLFSLIVSCDDGDIQIENLDFDSINIDFCNTKPVAPDVDNLLFKITGSQALIVELPSGTIRNEVSVDSIVRNVSVAGPSKITYRQFSDDITDDYFCSIVPLTEPTVLEEIVAQGGEIWVTTEISADSLNYEHLIQLSNISLVNSKNETLTDLSINNFGTVTTPIEEDEDI